MLLEEALAGSNTKSRNSPSSSSSSEQQQQQQRESQSLSPHETALALLSFLRDELPAGGIVAERRFVTLYPLIVDRVFGEWNCKLAEGEDRLSPRDGGAGSPVFSSPLASSPSNGIRNYQHADGGWLSLYSPPPSSSTSVGRSATKSSSLPLTSLEQDPIVRLLRAPAPLPPRDAGTKTTNTSSNSYQYTPPTLLDAISAESVHRPNINFKYPLGALSELSAPLMENWKVCYWNDIIPTKDEDNTAEVNGATMQGTIGKENATRILTLLVQSQDGGAGGRPMRNKRQLELSRYFQQLYQQQHQPTAQQRQQWGIVGGGGGGGGAGGGAVLSPPPLSSTFFTTPSKTRMTPSTTSGTGYRTPNNKGIPTTTTITPNEQNLELTMLEYYLFFFVRFPLANRYGRSSNSSNNNGLYGQRIYSHLFTNYMNSYLALGQEYNEDRLDVGINCFDCGDTTSSDPSAGDAMLSSVVTRKQTSELFLRLIIELWIEGPNVAPTTNDAVSRYRRVRAGVFSSNNNLSPSSSSNLNPSLRDSLELAKPNINTPWGPPPGRVQSGILNLVRHLLSDLSMRELVRKVSGVIQLRQREDRSGNGSFRTTSSVGADRSSTPTLENDDNSDRIPPNGSRGESKVSWPLPPAITAMQQSTYNYIRLGLACGAIHDRTSNFHWALETWLVWLEPWNYVVKRRTVVANREGSVSEVTRTTAGTILRNAAATVTSHHRAEYYPSLVQPKPTSPSTFSPQWESYIVCNAHFYTVPLAIFLKRARELDFSSSVEYPRSLALVQRVLRVYYTGVVNVLNSALSSRRADVLTSSLVARHGQNMGAYCPLESWKLIDCQLDGTNLLEEVFGQHQKRRAGMDMLDRLEAKFNALFEGKIGDEESALENLLTQVRNLVHLPLDYHVLVDEPARRGFGLWRLIGLGSKDAATTASSDDVQRLPDRRSDGTLTELGKQQLHAGLCKCNPLEVHYIGDPMFSRVKSYEIPTFVELTIRLSNYLNRKLGLVAPSSAPNSGCESDESGVMKRYREMQQYKKIKFRFNLRFLADARNIIFAFIVWRLVSTFRGFFLAN